MQEALSQEDFDSEPLWPLHFYEAIPSTAKTIGITAALAVGFGVLCATSRLLAQNSQHTAIFWIANGVLTALLLGRPRKLWWTFLIAACLGDAVVAVSVGVPLSLAAAVAVCNVLEALIAASLLRWALGRDRDLASPGSMGRFLLFAVAVAPLAPGVLAATCCHVALGIPFWHLLGKWYPAHALGMAVLAPLVLAWSSSDLRKVFGRERVLRSVSVLLLVFCVSIAVFEQTHYSLRFLCVPLLMLVVFEAGILGGVTAIFEIAVIGTLYTLRGHGPLWMEKGATMRGSILDLQIAMLVLVISVVPFAAMLERQRQLHQCLRLGIQRYRLLADNSRDIVVLSSLEGHRLYVSPAVQDALGWTRQEWTGHDSVELMHPDDIPAFHRMLQEMLHGDDRRTLRYRTQHKDGRYLWMEANVRTLRDEKSGKPNAFVANVRDISRRVDAEEKLAEAHQQVQEQAQRDSLTELANRRRFDDGLEKEWRRGRRTGSPLALLMVDIDNFKCVNDTYGHRAGDACLQALGGILRQVARRPGDIAARYGGDEFAVLLPDVDSVTARTLAESICLKVRHQLFQAGIGRAVTITVSVGVAAQIPSHNARADRLVEAADRALYSAKQDGRDRAVMKTPVEPVSAMLLHPVQ